MSDKRMNIEAERARVGMTKEELCKTISVSSKTYASYINGGNMPVEKAVLLARLFNCSLDYLTGLSENRNRAS